MKQTLLGQYAVMCLVVCSLGLYAGASGAQGLRDYKCIVERVTSADATTQNLEFLEKNFVGKEFTVDRRTGLMAGALKNAYITAPVVVDHGSNENSFKAVTMLRKEQGAGRSSNAYLLVVREYVASARKPFLFAENDDVYLGTCTHF